MSNHVIHMPDGIQIEDASEFSGRFSLQPLERGYGVTIGNAMRRVLLSSLEGVAITGVRIDGVQHEFSTIEGVTEDVADIILNFKEVRFRASEEAEDGAIHIVLRGPGSFTAKDIGAATNDYEVLNPDHHIATLDENAALSIELRIERGRGYIPADENKRADDPIGVIAIDAIFTPIRNVRYSVKPTRVGQKIDYEYLTMEIDTDGSISAEDALMQGATILRNHVDLFISMDSVPDPAEKAEVVDTETQRIRELLVQPVDELDLSVRAQNCLKAANITNIGDLVSREESEMLKFRNFGRKSLQELVHVLNDRGLHFGMSEEKYEEKA